MRALRITQTIALGAVQAAADAERVDPAVLSAAAYRRFRADDVGHALPSDVAIGLLFGGWHHACELAHDRVALDR